MNEAQVICLEGALKVILQFGDESEVAPGDEYVVDIDKKHNCVFIEVSKIQIGVCMRLVKLPSEEGGVKTSVPGAWASTEPVQGLVQFAHEVFGSLSNEPKWLKHVHIFVEDAIKEGGEDVELVDRPIEVGGDGEKKSNGLPSDYWCECIREVFTVFLFEAACYKSGFVPGRSTVAASFDLKYPFGRNGSFVRGKCNQRPGIVGLDGVHLFFHGGLPKGIGVDLLKCEFGLQFRGSVGGGEFDMRCEVLEMPGEVPDAVGAAKGNVVWRGRLCEGGHVFVVRGVAIFNWWRGC